jgi:dTDP-4-amino-4,6-dideoxygalactose transaminase
MDRKTRAFALAPRRVSVGTFSVTPRIRQLIEQVLESGQISYGPMSQEFEQRFAELHEGRYAILSNSGTSALQVALQAMKELHGWKDGDQVIIPATTFIATANIVLHNDMEPVVVDVLPGTFNIDPSQVADAVTPDTRCVIPVHLLGLPADTPAIRATIPNRVRMITDSCECMFVARGTMGLGDIGCFSTYVAHLIVTGVGGLCVTDSPEYAARIRSLVNHGLNLAQLDPDDNFAPRPVPGRRFKFASYGHSYRITEMEAALGLAQLDTRNAMLHTRRRNAKHLTAGLKNINEYYGNPFYLQPEPKQHAHMMYPIVLNKDGDGNCVSKEPLMQYLLDNQIEVRDIPSILGHQVYSWLHPAEFPVSNWLLHSGFYVGCHQDMTPEDCQYVLYHIERFCDRKGSY